MSTQDQNKKTLRHFQCRDYLWEIFEQMSTELECSTDYLINEAMRQYARSRNYGTSRSGQRDPTGAGTNPNAEVPAPPAAQAPHPAAPAPTHGASSGGIPSLRENAARPSIPSPPPPRPRVSAAATSPMAAAIPSMQAHAAQNTPTPSPAPRAPAAPPAPPPPKRASSMPPPPPGPRGTGSMARPPSVVANPPPLPGGGARASMAPPAAPPARPRQLFIIFNGQKIPVTKEEFVIGRGSKSADLAIKDGNISRRHAAVVLHNGGYYMKDLGSTNGVEYQGRRFDSKRIEEGDVFRICDYELRFSYQ